MKEIHLDILQDNFITAKLKISKMNKILPVNNCINFHGNEGELMVRHFRFITLHTAMSSCNNKACRILFDKTTDMSFPHIIVENQISEKINEEEVSDWMYGKTKIHCGKIFKCVPPVDAPVFQSKRYCVGSNR